MRHVTKFAKQWIDKAIKHPGALHKHFGIPEDEKIPVAKLKATQSKLRAKDSRTPEESTLLKQVNLALSLRKL